LNRIKVAGISGSLRNRSLNSGLIRAAVRLAPKDLLIEIVPIIDLPVFNQDLENPGQIRFPEVVQVFRDHLANADALLFTIPENNWSVSAAIKNAFDWASRGPSPLDGKPAAIMGAGGRGGTFKAQLHFRQIASHNDIKIMPAPEIGLSKAESSFSESGDLIDSTVSEQIKAFLLAFNKWIQDHQEDQQLI